MNNEFPYKSLVSLFVILGEKLSRCYLWEDYKSKGISGAPHGDKTFVVKLFPSKQAVPSHCFWGFASKTKMLSFGATLLKSKDSLAFNCSDVAY
jgi:hypothetical protein